jgi:hypothetical protein
MIAFQRIGCGFRWQEFCPETGSLTDGQTDLTAIANELPGR